MDALVVARQRGRSPRPDAELEALRAAASAAWRSRRSTASAAKRRGSSPSCRKPGSRCSSHRCAKRSASISAWTWRPAPAGRSAGRGSARTCAADDRAQTWTLEAGQALAEPVRLQQAPLLRALRYQVYEVAEIKPGEQPPAGAATARTRSDVRPLTIADHDR